MSVSAHYVPPTYDGNGTSTLFPTVFPFRAGIDLLVTRIVIATGVETVLRMFRDYTTEGGEYENGTVVALTAPAETVQWRIERRTPNFIDYEGELIVPPEPTAGAFLAVGNNNIAVILRSLDGATWTDVTPALSPDLYSWGFNCVASDPTAWVVGGFGPNSTDGIQRSTDGGLTWTGISLPAALDTSINSIVSPADGVFVACDRTQIFKSTDSGATWTQIAHGMAMTSIIDNFINLACNRAGVSLAALAGVNEAYGISEDDGATWLKTATGINFTVANHMSYANGTWIMGLTGGGIDYSTTAAPQAGNWSTINYVNSVNTEDWVWDGTRYWAIGNNGQMKTTSLAVEPTLAAVPDRYFALGVLTLSGTTYFCDGFPRIGTTTGGTTTLTAQTIPTLIDSFELWEMAHRA